MIDKTNSFLVLFGVFIVLCGYLNAADEEDTFIRRRRIINGENARSSDYPWIVSLQGKRKSKFMSFLTGKAATSYCGGTLISDKWIVSAAHCFFTKKGRRSIPMTKPKYWHVRMADEKLKPDKMEKYKGYINYFTNKFLGTKREQNYYHVSKIIVHPGYKDGVLENDIAVLKLKENINFKKLGDAGALPVPWPLSGKVWPMLKDPCVVVGWGCGRAGGPPQLRVKKAIMPVISGDQCRSIYSSYINLTDSKEFCAGYAGRGVGICPGDSGGPIACPIKGQYYLAGVVSATHSTRPENYPGLFTRLSYFMDWIKQQMRRY